MIELNNLLLATLVNFDSGKECLDFHDIDELNTDIEFNDNDTLSSDELELSPQSFLLLMAQVVTDNSDEATSPVVNANTDKKSTDSNPPEISYETVNNRTQNQNQSQLQPELLDSETNVRNQLQLVAPKNIALTWIDSEDYLPPNGHSHEIISESYPLITGDMPTFDDFKEKLLPTKDIQIKLERAASYISPESKEDLFTSDSTKPNEPISTPQIDQGLIEKHLVSDGEIQFHPIQTVNYSPGSSDSTTVQTDARQRVVEVPVNINHEQWADKFSEQIIWLGHHSVKSALIKIHPEDLGPVEISIKVVKDAASVNINTHNNYVKDIVDQALPRLREMMAEQGMNLSEVNVQSDANSRQYSQSKDESAAILNQESEQEIQGTTRLNRRPPKGLIDYFA